MFTQGRVVAAGGKQMRWKQIARIAWYACAAVALGIFLLSVAAQALAVGDDLQGQSGTPGPSPLPYAMHMISFLAYGAATLTSFVLAIVLFLKRPDDGMALFLSYFLLVYGVVEAGVLSSLSFFWPGMASLAYSVAQPLLFAPLLVTFLVVFPSGSFVPERARWLVVAAMLYGPTSLLLLNAPELSLSGAEMLYRLGVTLWFGLIFGGLYTQVYRFRHVSTGTERQQTKWVLYGLSLEFLLAALLTFWTVRLRSLPPGTQQPPLALGILGWSVAIAALPVSLSIAMLRYRLYDIDAIIKRTLVYGALTATVVAIYALSVGVLSLLFQAQGNPIISLFATGLVAVLFHPLRERLQSSVDRLFYGRRDDPLLALSQLGKRLEAAIAPEVVLPTLVETITQTLKLPYAAISLRSRDGFRIAARRGDEVEDVIEIPLTYQGETVGQLIVGPRAPGESFSQADRELLNHIAHQAGAAAYTVQLTQDLRQSRVHLVTAREEERRRLRRDLHDGLGPVLASQGLKMAAASQVLRENPEQAQRLLEELAAQNEATVNEIRRLVYELRPPALDELGLVEAIDDFASALNGSASEDPRLRVRFEAMATELPPLPAAVEVAVYRIATEALTNVARHARAQHAVVSLSLGSASRQRRLCLTVVDDGIGVAGDARAGIGLVSMRERAEEVGGVLRVGPGPECGTQVIAEFPLLEEP